MSETVMGTERGDGKGRLADLLPSNRIVLDEEAADWEAATRLAGALLVSDGVVEERYVEAMVEAVRSLGPYIVLAPGVALPHARPEDGAAGNGFSLLRLRRQVAFGHEQHDPVDLVIALAAADKTGHVRAMATLGTLLSDQAMRERLRTSPTPEDLHELIATADADEGAGEDTVEVRPGERAVRLRNPSGLHARPASMFAQRAATHGCDVMVRKGEREANGKSVLSVLTLDVRQGDEIKIRTQGHEAATALEDLVGLVESGIGEEVAEDD